MSYSRIFFILNDQTGTFEEIIVNCSQKQFVANLLILLVSYAFFRLADFSSDSFDFRLQKRDKKVAPKGH